VGTDPAGDHVVADIASEYPADAKSFKVMNKWMTGTGKYAGISGDGTFVGHAQEFRTAVEGTYAT
jgi:hypothetical protein